MSKKIRALSGSACERMLPVVFCLAACSPFDTSLLDGRRQGEEAGQEAGGGDSAISEPVDAAMRDASAEDSGADAGGAMDADLEDGAAPPSFDAGIDADLDADLDASIDGSLDAGDSGGPPDWDASQGDGGEDAALPDAQPACGSGGVDCCPDDPNKTAPGACGCGLSETMAAQCTALRGALRHRYRFEGEGTTVLDSVSGADGVLVDTTLDGSSTLTLSGGTSDQHVDLPDGMISTLQDATFEAWLSWQGGDPWQRVLDFGDSTGGAGSQGSSGSTYLYLTPRSSFGDNPVRAVLSLSGSENEVVVTSDQTLVTGELKQLVLVVDDQNELRLYIDGVLRDSAPLTMALSDINDVNNWLGRSQYQSDPELGAIYHEFRIYQTALSDDEVQTSFAAGPDPLFLEQ